MDFIPYWWTYRSYPPGLYPPRVGGAAAAAARSRVVGQGDGPSPGGGSLDGAAVAPRRLIPRLGYSNKEEKYAAMKGMLLHT